MVGSCRLRGGLTSHIEAKDSGRDAEPIGAGGKPMGTAGAEPAIAVEKASDEACREI